MWVGATTVLYLSVVCLSGCIVLFERDLYRWLSPDPAVEPVSVSRLSNAELINITFTRYPEHRVVGVWDKKFRLMSLPKSGLMVAMDCTAGCSIHIQVPIWAPRSHSACRSCQ